MYIIKKTVVEPINQSFESELHRQLLARKQNGLYRSLKVRDNTIDFSSNDYLGFARMPAIIQAGDEQLLPAGATGSRLISGHSLMAEETEALIAQFHGAEAALIFNAGYMANVGLFSCIAAKGDTFIGDEYLHASIIDGMRLSHATRFKFKHNSLPHLEQKLQAATGRKLVVVESIYSMDGDEAPLQAIADLCQQYNALLLVDEAHATGIYGSNGQGLVSQLGLENKVLARVHTFGKALGLHGAAVVGSSVLKEYLINFARSFIYATGLPPKSYLQIQQAYLQLHHIDKQELTSLIQYYNAHKPNLASGHFLQSQSPIQGVILGSNKLALQLAAYLLAAGIHAKAILSPTVPAGKERIRLCLHIFNTTQQIDALFELLKSFEKIA